MTFIFYQHEDEDVKKTEIILQNNFHHDASGS